MSDSLSISSMISLKDIDLKSDSLSELIHRFLSCLSIDFKFITPNIHFCDHNQKILFSWNKDPFFDISVCENLLEKVMQSQKSMYLDARDDAQKLLAIGIWVDELCIGVLTGYSLYENSEFDLFLIALKLYVERFVELYVELYKNKLFVVTNRFIFPTNSTIFEELIFIVSPNGDILFANQYPYYFGQKSYYEILRSVMPTHLKDRLGQVIEDALKKRNVTLPISSSLESSVVTNLYIYSNEEYNNKFVFGFKSTRDLFSMYPWFFRIEEWKNEEKQYSIFPQGDLSLKKAYDFINGIPDLVIHSNFDGKVLHVKGSKHVARDMTTLMQPGVNLYNVLPDYITSKMKIAFQKCYEKGEAYALYNLTQEHHNFVFEGRYIKYNDFENIAIIRNITQLIELDSELLEAKDRAESESSAKTQFLANMSHEIRTPMNAILGFTEILLEEVQDKDHKGYLEIIHNSGNNLLSVINSILDLSKVEAGRIELQPTALNFHRMFDELKNIFSHKLGENGNTIDIKLIGDFFQNFYLDPLRVRQILTNLIGNAIKFTEQGKITIEASAARLDSGMYHIRIKVIDTGIGIPEDQLMRIFNAFEQTKYQDQNKYRGTGLGLAISLKLAELMKGTITVKSEYGCGSTFSFILPEVKSISGSIAEPAKFKDSKKEIDFNKSTLLIVDDVPYNIELIKSYMSSYSINVITAKNGIEAIGQAKRYKPNLILMDINMPHMGGKEANMMINRDPDTSNIPVLAFTASLMENELKLLTSDFEGIIQKPIKKDVLMDAILAFLPIKSEK